jgi:membrane associated rhomboid family serine protease
MGIYDRDYYRNEGPSILDSLMPTGVVCRWLIGINVAVFILQLISQQWAPNQEMVFGGERFVSRSDGFVTDWFILDPVKVAHGEVWRLLTYAFLHAPNSITHILFNMLFLWWFGSDVEQLYGRKEFLAIYLLSALSGGIAYEAWSMTQANQAPCLGASGAITTLLVLCACHFPRRTIYVFMILPMPIWLFAILFVVMDAFYFLSQYKTNVAVVVHLAGAGFAFAYYKMQFNITDHFREWMSWKQTRSRSRLKLFDPVPEKEEPVAVSAASSSIVMDEHLEAKLDAILEKIALTGKESLTHQEQEVLRQAAEMYKRRRN